jgi:hypothetical protein
MSSDVMFAAGSEKGLFERIDVCNSGPENFAAGISSDLPEFMRDLLKIKQSDLVFNQEGTVIPFGCWKPDQTGLKGYVKTCKDGRQALVCVNTDADQALSLRLPKRIRTADNLTILNAEGSHNIAGIADEISLNPYQIMIITCNRSKK